MLIANCKLTEGAKLAMLSVPAAPSGASATYVDLKTVGRVTFVVTGVNATGNTTTGPVLTFTQATAVAGTNSKALSPVNYDYAVGNHTVPSDVLATVTLGNSTLTIGNVTNSSGYIYAIEIRGSDLDAANGFTCAGIQLGNSTTTVQVLAVGRDERYPFDVADVPTMLT